MTPLKIGACVMIEEVTAHRDWLFESDRDIEIQNFMSFRSLTTDLDDCVVAAQRALDGHSGRVGIHGPFQGLDIDNEDPEIREITTRRFNTALEAADRIGARQMVLHSPYTRWYQNNVLASEGYANRKLDQTHSVLGPVVKNAEDKGITLVIENIHDVRPETRRTLVESFGSDAIAVSIDTGHAQLARRMSGAPPVEDFVRDAGKQLGHVHIQDLDGYADRHWAPGEGEIEWLAVFRALAACGSDTHLVLELKCKEDIPKGFAYLRDLGVAI